MNKRIKCCLILLLTITNTLPLFSTEAELKPLAPGECKGKIVSVIQFSGNSRTADQVVRRELMLSEGKVFSLADYNETIIRLKNLQVFSKVEPTLYKGELDNEIILEITFQEKWTTIPIFRFGGGGGVNYIVLGLYDINVLGKYLEVGGQYENFGGQHNGVVWYRNPRFLNKRQRFGIDIWSIMNNRENFDYSGELNSAYTIDRKRLNFFLDKEFRTWLIWGLGVDLHDDTFSDFGLDDEQLDTNSKSQYTLPEKAQNFFLYTYGDIGRLKYDNYLVDGAVTSIKFEHAHSTWGSDETFYRIILEEKAFMQLPQTSNAAVRISVGITDSLQEQSAFYKGGLDAVRGFDDGFFKGRAYWLANLEYRIPSIKTDWFVLQHVVFFDVGNVADKFTDLTKSVNDEFYSGGIGVRLISPRIYRFNFRIDYAFGYGHGKEMQGISFGSQQFF